jgi:hypothetical protein
LFRMKIPSDFSSKSDFKSPMEIAEKLGVTDEDHMFIFDLTHGLVHDAYRTSSAVTQTPACLLQFETKMEQSFLVISPCGLFQLMTLANRRPGTRQVGSDGSGGFCKDGSSFVTIGTPAVGLVKDKMPDVRSSLRTIAYLHLGGERYHPYCLSLYTLRWLCKILFGTDLELDWGTSDHADAFIKAHRFFHCYPCNCDAKIEGK